MCNQFVQVAIAEPPPPPLGRPGEYANPQESATLS